VLEIPSAEKAVAVEAAVDRRLRAYVRRNFV